MKNKSSKQKTRKAATKRFKITATGKVLHRGHGVRHLRDAKQNKTLRSAAVPREITGTHKKKIKKMLGR